MGSRCVPGLCLLVLLIHARAAQQGKAVQAENPAGQGEYKWRPACGAWGTRADLNAAHNRKGPSLNRHRSGE